MKFVDLELSTQLSSIIEAEIGCCVSNVVRSIKYFYSTIPHPVEYVEGIWCLGGQAYLHTWLETRDSIIDPTLICLSNTELKDEVLYYAILRRTEKEVQIRFADQIINQGVILEMLLTWDDPRVDEILDRYDL